MVPRVRVSDLAHFPSCYECSKENPRGKETTFVTLLWISRDLLEKRRKRKKKRAKEHTLAKSPTASRYGLPQCHVPAPPNGASGEMGGRLVGEGGGSWFPHGSAACLPSQEMLKGLAKPLQVSIKESVTHSPSSLSVPWAQCESAWFFTPSRPVARKASWLQTPAGLTGLWIWTKSWTLWVYFHFCCW